MSFDGELDHVGEVAKQWALVRPDLDLEAIEILGRILRSAAMIRMTVKRTAAAYGIDETELSVLKALYRARLSGPITPTALIKTLLVTSGGVSKVIDRLEIRGLISRHPDLDDRRRTVLELTTDGYELIVEVTGAQDIVDHRTVSGLSTSDRNSLNSILRQLLVFLEPNAVIGEE